MFVYRKVYPFTWTVKVPEGVVPAFEFQAKFVSLPQSELDKLRAEFPQQLDEKLSAKVFKGWAEGDLLDEEEKPLPVTDENVAKILDLPFVRAAIVLGWFAAMSGLNAKN